MRGRCTYNLNGLRRNASTLSNLLLSVQPGTECLRMRLPTRALPGQTVCRTGDVVTVNGTLAGEALDLDHLGRFLPTWQCCRVVAVGDAFLMHGRSAALVDGRYVGPLSTTNVIGQAAPLWTSAELGQ